LGPTPKSPIPNPQSPIPNYFVYYLLISSINLINYNLKSLTRINDLLLKLINTKYIWYSIVIIKIIIIKLIID